MDDSSDKYIDQFIDNFLSYLDPLMLDIPIKDNLSD